VSPTAPTIVTLNAQLTNAYRRIRELEAREFELLAQNEALHAASGHDNDHDNGLAPPLSGTSKPIARLNTTMERDGECTR
jgi:hypothetical protein